MPEYCYINRETQEIKSVFQSMQEEHTYSENGVKWDRVWEAPRVSFDSQIDPWSARSFTDATGAKNGTMGDIWDLSREMQQKRAQGGEIDPLSGKKVVQDKKEKPSEIVIDIP